MQGHDQYTNVRSVQFSPDGRRIVSGSDDTSIRVWGATVGVEVLPTIRGHSDRVNSTAFSPDGKTIVSGSSDRAIRIWDAMTGDKLTVNDELHGVPRVAFSQWNHGYRLFTV